MIYLDTHILVWLYNGLVEKLSHHAQSFIEKNALLTSPLSILELQYLYEIKRITVPAIAIINDLEARIGLQIDDNRLEKIIKKSLNIAWTRDPFDRMIVSSAEIRKIKLLTKDEMLLKHCSLAVW